MHKNPEKTRLHSDKKADTLDINRRDFLTKSALLGVATGTIGLGLAPTTAFAKDEKLVMTSASNFQPLEVNSPMAKWKKPQSLDFVTGATKRYSFRNWQSGNDDSVYYNMNLPAFFKTRVVMPPTETSLLKRDINADLLNITFKAHDGTTFQKLKE